MADSKRSEQKEEHNKKKVKATSQKEQILVINLDIKLGQFMQELDSVLRKTKNRKAAGLDEIPPEVWKTRELRHPAPILSCRIKPKHNRQMDKGMHPPFP